VGATASWGHLQVHAAGFRAEYACIVALGYQQSAMRDTIAALARIASRYRVQLVPLTELEQVASRHGTPLPDTLLHSTSSASSVESPGDANPELATGPQTTHAMQGPSLSAHRPAEVPDGAGTPSLFARARVYVLLAVLGLGSLATGVDSLFHPVVVWGHSSYFTKQEPTILGPAFLLIAVILFGVIVRKALWDLELDLEAIREWKRRKRSKITTATRQNPD
jgi:hypothetical protein